MKIPIKFSLPVSYLLLFILSLALSALLFLTQPNTNTSVVSLIVESRGLTFLLNWIPVALVMFLLFFLSGKLVLSAGLGAVIFFLPSVVNRYMVAMRAAPFQPLDFLLGMEFLGIAKSIPVRVYIAVAAGALLFIALFIAAFKIIRNGKPQKPARIIGSAACAVLAAVLFLTVYENDSVYAGLPLQGNQYSEVNQYQSKGFVYSFIHAVHSSRLEKPPGYNEDLPEIKTLAESPQEDQSEPLAESSPEEQSSQSEPLAEPPSRDKLPHLIFVQSEAFSEIPLSEALDFNGFTDPLQNYKTIKEESLNGYIVAPHLGGGTSDTEFDVLTGMNTRALRGVPYTFTLIKKPFPGITSALKSNGYAAMAMHPGAGWFYNRQNVYPLLGFDIFMDDGYYDTADTKGLYITERQTMDKLMDEFEVHTEKSGAPLFMFCITIQNHGPYYQKYFKEGTNFGTDLSLTEFDTNSLANYFEGVKDADEELRRIKDYFAESDEPAVMVYFGDHLPSFELDLLTALDPLPEDAPAGEQMIKYNRLPFLIWTNESAKPLVDLTAFEESLPGDRTVSAHYLGAAILEAVGLGSGLGFGGDSFLDYVNALRPDYPIVLDRIYRPKDEAAEGSADLQASIEGGGTDLPPSIKGGMDMLHFGEGDAAGEKALELYNSWSYYRIMEE